MLAPHSVFGAAGVASIDHLNDHHRDSVELLVRTLTSSPHLAEASLLAIDRTGVDALGRTPGAPPRRFRIAFAERADDLDAARHELTRLVRRARDESGLPGETSIERELRLRLSIPTFVTEVVAVDDVVPGMRRIVVRSGLERFRSLGPAEFVHVLAPPEGCAGLEVDEGFTWERHRELPAAIRPVGAYYTVRRHTPEVEGGEIEMWVVLHDAPGAGADWARRAAPGDRIALWGPRDGHPPPVDARRLLLLGDETAVPAIASIAGRLPPDVTATAVIETGDLAQAMPIASSADLTVRWRARHGAAPGTSSLLFTELAALLPRLGADTHVWAAGETVEMADLRALLRRAGLDRRRATVTGYWRRVI